MAVNFLFFILQALVAVSVSQHPCHYDVSPPEHGSIRYSANRSYYQITCNPGYLINGDFLVYCESGYWIDSLVKCIAICPLPPPLEHGTVIDCSALYMPRVNQKCRFRCNQGYILHGPPYLTCTESRKLVDNEGRETFPVCKVDEERRSKKTNPCSNHQCAQLCRIENGRAQCRCNRGFVLNKADQKSCDVRTGPPIHPLNPCKKNNGGCAHKCAFIRHGENACSCHSGYTLATDGKSCIGTEEPSPRITCEVNNGGCQYYCTMKGSTVQCSCPRDYELGRDKKHCIRAETPRVTCDVNNGGCEHSCSMKWSNVECSCRRGYRLDRDMKHCIDIDECKDEYRNPCQHYCKNTEGSYTCSCIQGYVLIENHKCEGCRKSSYWSVEKNGCVDCPANSYTESEGKASISDCVCNSGFTGNPGENSPCEDIDECASNNFGCSDTCVNAPGDVFCSCPIGYAVDKDNKTCIDIDECSIKNGGCEGDCYNTDGSFYCKCLEGYVSSNKDQYSCEDIDECLESNGGCEQLCVNFRGGYYCACEKGFRLDSGLKNCTDINCPSLPIPHYSTMICKKNKVNLTEMDNYPIGTICTFNCMLGFKDSAQSKKMKCQGDGTWAGNLAECKSQSCSPLNVPENGDVHPKSCSTHGNTVKQKCTFTCRLGYKQEGNSVFTCKNNLTWSTGKAPHCKPVEIRPTLECTGDISVILPPGKDSENITLPAPVTNMENYTIRPDWVSTGRPIEFPAGVTKVVFNTNSSTSNRTAKCIIVVKVLDEEPPVFQSCPGSINIENASGDGELITWEEPIVADNVKVESVRSSMESNTTLTPGSYVVEYIAKDSSGNTASCSFSIDIVRIRCGDLTAPAHGEANCMDWLYGRLCQPQCDDGYMRNPDHSLFYSCDDSGEWEPNDIISECLAYEEAMLSQCPDGMELKTIEESGEKICLECPSNTVWSSTTGNCEETTK